MVQNISMLKVFLSLALVTSANSCWILARLLWSKASDQWCTAGDTYKNVEDAQAACASADGSDCLGVYDDGCDGRGEAYVCKTDSVSDPDSGGWVIKPAPSTGVFQPTSLSTLKRAVKGLVGKTPTGNFPKWGDEATDVPPPSYSSFKFQRLDISEPSVGFDDLHGSIVYAVRRMGWQLCREGAMQITQAAKDLNLNNVRLVAIAKERLGWEEFTLDYWPPPAEIYFDTAEPGFPFFKATNGKNIGVAKMLASYIFGGEVANKLKRTEHIQGNNKGEGLVLGSVMVVSSTGDVLLHHKEKAVGEHPDDEELRAAMKAAMKAAVAQLGRTGVVSCECEDEKKKQKRLRRSTQPPLPIEIEDSTPLSLKR